MGRRLGRRVEISATPLWADICCTAGALDVQAAAITQIVTAT
jgi:hypothetical protein